MQKDKSLADNLAVTLQYEGTGAPKVTAKGQGHMAEQIIKTAQSFDIPVQQDQQLVGVLSQVELNQEIPETLYEAVAQVLIFAYQLNHKDPFNSHPKQTSQPE